MLLSVLPLRSQARRAAPSSLSMHKSRLSGTPLSSSSFSFLSRMASISPSPVDKGPWEILSDKPHGNGKVEALWSCFSAAANTRLTGLELVPLRALDDAPTSVADSLGWCRSSP